MALGKSVLLVVGASVAILVGGCSSSTHDASTDTTAAPPVTRAPAPAGPAATVSGPITGGKGESLLGSGFDHARVGYTDQEYFASGMATSYRSEGTQGRDGRWKIAAGAQAPYRTRIIVRRPRDAAKFNGTLLVEWLNVSSGTDTAPDFTYAANEITRSGYAWVGVSAQKIGVSGGQGAVPVAGLPTGGLRGIDPERYGSLQHPGDQYALDIFSQVARSMRIPGRFDPLAHLRVQRMVAIGESQSAFQLTSYIDAIQPTARIFDGFFVHSRGGGAIPIGGGDITTGISGGVRIRDDIGVPVLLFETETDEALLRYFDARQPDTDHIRLWDVAGAAHADAFVVGGNANALGCKGGINTAPTHYVVAAAIHQLDRWIRTGTPPAPAPRMKVALVKDAPVVQRDARGNAIGGVRTGANDVPVATLSGVAADTSNVLCTLFGGTTPFSATTLTNLYGNRASYLAKFRAATDKAIARGYLLPADRAAILAEAAKVTF